MSRRRMHADEVDVDESLVRGLINEQFPEWRERPLETLETPGTNSVHFRLGADLVVRLSVIERAVKQVERDRHWLPLLAPHLPVPIPAVVAVGSPGLGYPWAWSVYRWIDGDSPVPGTLEDASGLTQDLGAFVRAMRDVPVPDGPRARRGVPLASCDTSTREAIAAVGHLVDAQRVLARWQAALAAPPWMGPNLWVHGDLSPGNILVAGGRLRAVIDFGSIGVGDPACDLIVAWNLLPASQRAAFRSATAADDAMWARGRGWALTISLLQLPYYLDTNPWLAHNSRHVIDEILAENQAG